MLNFECIKPDYDTRSIVNLMASVGRGLQSPETAYAPLPELDPALVANARHVVLLVFDGLGYNYLEHRATLLRRFLKGRMTSVFPSSTAPAITTFMSGVAPQQHGVSGWFMNLRECGAVVMLLPFRPRCGGPPLSGLCAKTLIDAPSFFDALPIAAYYLMQHELRDSHYSIATAGAARRLAYRDLDDYFYTIAKTIRSSRQRAYIYAYWPLFDALSHRHGVASIQTAAHFQELERGFGTLVNSLAGTDTLLIATADHGFVDTAPEYIVHLRDHPQLSECLSLPLCGEPRAAYAYVRPAKTRFFERYVSEKLNNYCTMYPAAEFLDMGWFGLGEATPRLAERIGDYVLLTKNRCAIKDALPMESDWRDIGVHGGVSADEMYVPLIVAQC